MEGCRFGKVALETATEILRFAHVDDPLPGIEKAINTRGRRNVPCCGLPRVALGHRLPQRFLEEGARV